MSKIIEFINKKTIISCQASHTEPFYDSPSFMAMINSCINGGAEVLRIESAKNIALVKRATKSKIIGITKPQKLPENWKEIVYITPTFKDAEKLAKADADIIAIDGTSRQRPKENLAELIYKIKTELNKPVIADISTLEEGINCALLGADIISTTLSGYTQNTLSLNNGQPDFELLEKLVKTINLPIILEGRIWEPVQVKRAFEIGAHSVVIGSAITRPHLITKRFIMY